MNLNIFTARPLSGSGGGTSGRPVTGGSPNSVLYVDASGNLNAADPNITYTAGTTTFLVSGKISGTGIANFGTGGGTNQVSVINSQNAGTILSVTNSTNNTAALSRLQADSDTGTVVIDANSSGRIATRYGVSLSGALELRVSSGTSLLIGSLLNIPIVFGVNGAEAGRFTSAGFNGVVGGTTPAAVAATTIAASSTSTLTGAVGIGKAPAFKLDVMETANARVVYALADHASFTDGVFIGNTTRSANAAFNLLDLYAGSVRKFVIDGTGAITAVSLAGTGSRAVLADANGLLSAPISDADFKQNLVDLPASYGMQAIMALRPKIWDYKDHARFGPQKYIGFDAGHTATVLPEVTGRMYDGPIDPETKKGTLGTHYMSKEDIVAALVLHNQQMQEQINDLQAQVQALQ